MRETNFIKQNEEKWREFESVMENPHKDPDKLNDLFVQITDDLSYSRTFYPNRSVRVYLNGLAQRIFLKIYKNRRSHGQRLVTFWTDELPRLVIESRQAFRFSFFVFVLAVLIGVVSSAMDEEFASIILGDAYVEMTMENIESGDPMAVYKQKGAFGMSLGITFNNLWVAFLTFVLGAFFTIGSIAILIRNGIMLGAFQYFFIEKELFWESFLTIWIHGTIEISAIIIAGAAGITMGKGLVFPGTYSRIQSFQRSARRGIKLMVGITPLIIMAGFIEGYLTRHTDTPDIIRALFIAACLVFVLFYFVWYPRYRARVGFRQAARDDKIAPNRSQQIRYNRIKNSGEIFAEIFVLYRRYFGKIAITALGTSILYCAGVFLLGEATLENRFAFPSATWEVISAKPQFFINEKVPFISLINAVCFTLLSLVAFRFVWLEDDKTQKLNRRQWLMGLVNVLIPMALLQLVIRTNDWYTIFLIMAVLPIISVWAYAGFREQKLLPQALGRAIPLIQSGIGLSLGLFTIMLILAFIFTMLADTALAALFVDLITWVVHFEAAEMATFSTIVLTFTSTYLLHLTLTMLFLGGGLLYYSLKEAHDATALKESIQNIGRSRKIQGLDRE